MSDPKVSDLLKKINATLNHSSFPAVERIEYDILLKNIAKLYELLQDIRVDAVDIRITEPAFEDIPVKEEIIESHQPEEILLKIMPEVQNPVFVLNDVGSETETTAVKEEKKQEPVVETKIPEVQLSAKPEIKQEHPAVQVKETAKTSINEGFKSSGGLNESLSNKPAAEINRKLASTNLKELIDLNKRILFVNDLFNGDANFYAKAIDELNSCDTYEKAYTNYTWFAEQMHWKPELQATRLLLKLIKQKFNVDIEQ
jgi:hypothetical protein